jgi:hypothetical protein
VGEALPGLVERHGRRVSVAIRPVRGSSLNAMAGGDDVLRTRQCDV